MSETRQLPNIRQALHDKGSTAVSWFRFFAAEHIGTPPANEEAILVNPSPHVFTATRKGALIVNAGTVNMIQWARSSTNYVTGQTAGMFPVAAGDSLIITYTGAPNLVFVPM